VLEIMIYSWRPGYRQRSSIVGWSRCRGKAGEADFGSMSCFCSSQITRSPARLGGVATVTVALRIHGFRSCQLRVRRVCLTVDIAVLVTCVDAETCQMTFTVRKSSTTLTPPSPRSQVSFLPKLLSGRNCVFLDILSGPNG